MYDFEHVGDAHKMLEERKNLGKVILVPRKEDAEAWNSGKKKSST